MNSLMVIVPYKYEGLWVFDDAAVGLSKEPFIAGIDSLIDKATANIPDAQHGFRAIFSARQFSRRELQTGMASSGIGRQLVLQSGIQSGRLAVPGVIQVFQECAAGNLRKGRAA